MLLLIYTSIIIILILLSGFFSGCEIGFYRINRIRLRFRAEHGWPGAKSLLELTENPQSTITSILVGNNITHYLVTITTAEILVYLGVVHSADLYGSLIVPPVLLIFAEIMPKSLFYNRTDAIMYRVSTPLRICQIILWPILIALDVLWHFIRKTLGETSEREQDLFTVNKLRSFLSEGADRGVLSEYQKKMTDNILHVKSLDIRRAMIPLKDIVMIKDDSSWDKLKEVMDQHRYSRIPVYKDKRSNIIGVINIIDLVAEENGVHNPKEVLRKPLYLDQDISVAEALYALQRSHQQLAVITNTKDEARGIVTIKDLVEEIVGELQEW